MFPLIPQIFTQITLVRVQAICEICVIRSVFICGKPK